MGEALIRTCAAHEAAKVVASGERPSAAAAAVLAKIADEGADGGLMLVTMDGVIETAFNSPGMKRAIASFSQPAQVGVVGGALRLVGRCATVGD